MASSDSLLSKCCDALPNVAISSSRLILAIPAAKSDIPLLVRAMLLLVSPSPPPPPPLLAAAATIELDEAFGLAHRPSSMEKNPAVGA
eukprot:CAMPEP_0178688068 /NCGR_PEP_ID=MMETSP0699-20121125/4794_1 /TAXON_ID=265572 /ORGANISM="Extubocellulus spinifer, Strain CCMP396" /LENGTH=87 /DNA_ID=CAMNT_0020333013 /DNA_START=276 /DNA_END=539 /DNA_ORIENTATION=-